MLFYWTESESNFSLRLVCMWQINLLVQDWTNSKRRYYLHIYCISCITRLPPGWYFVVKPASLLLCFSLSWVNQHTHRHPSNRPSLLACCGHFHRIRFTTEESWSSTQALPGSFIPRMRAKYPNPFIRSGYTSQRLFSAFVADGIKRYP